MIFGSIPRFLGVRSTPGFTFNLVKVMTSQVIHDLRGHSRSCALLSAKIKDNHEIKVIDLFQKSHPEALHKSFVLQVSSEVSECKYMIREVIYLIRGFLDGMIIARTNVKLL